MLRIYDIIHQNYQELQDTKISTVYREQWRRITRRGLSQKQLNRSAVEGREDKRGLKRAYFQQSFTEDIHGAMPALQKLAGPQVDPHFSQPKLFTA